MSLLADKKITRTEDSLFGQPVAASAKIYLGALLNTSATGYAKPSSDTAGEKFLGVSEEPQDNTSGANGALTVQGRRGGVFRQKAAGMTQANVGDDAYVVDDETAGLGITAQPVNVTGIVLKRIPTSRGGTRALAFTASGTVTCYGAGPTVNVGAGGEFVLTAGDGSQILAVVTAGSLPVGNQSDNIALRNVRIGKIAEVESATSVFVDIER